MTQPTHTHKTQGGRWAALGSHTGTGPLEGHEVVILKDIDKDITSVTTYEDWHGNWKPIAADDCTLCLGSGRDAIKGNKANPCGGCYGLGKVKANDEKPADEWQLADVALGIIRRLRQENEALRHTAEDPEVIELLRQRAKRQQKEPPGWVQKEQAWREGSGRGHGGRRHTGD